MMFIPVKMKSMAWVLPRLHGPERYSPALRRVFSSFYWLMPLVPLLNYFLSSARTFRTSSRTPGAIAVRSSTKPPTPPAQSPTPTGLLAISPKLASALPPLNATPLPGCTDTDYPNLEFRYWSKSNGYYVIVVVDHINTNPRPSAEAS